MGGLAGLQTRPVERPSASSQRRVAGWMAQLGAPQAEPSGSRRMAHLGGSASVGVLLAYLAWRILYTLPGGQWNLVGAWSLIAFEALPLGGLVLKLVTLWNIDGRGPEPTTVTPIGMRVTVLIPTYNEPAEVIVPTIAAACELQPTHETWVLDDGDRHWVAEICEAYGARYISRPHHEHAKAGNMNHALAVMESEAADRGETAEEYDIIAVLDCDHVPLPTFLTATLGWFQDDDIALVQGPQTFYNSGAFDDDDVTGEQGLFFNVLMPARNHDGAGPFWCGSTSLLRVQALREVGGVATETIVEDMHTTLKLIRAGWKTVYHHQTLALGLAPATAEQYLLQRRRWGMGAMQVLTLERLWAAKRWMSWRNYYEYLTGTLWWLEGVATILAFVVPTVVLLTGATTSTANPAVFAAVFLASFSARLWGAKRLLRRQVHWPTAFALRIFRVPIAIACLWWLVSRRNLQFQVTPKGGNRGAAPRTHPAHPVGARGRDLRRSVLCHRRHHRVGAVAHNNRRDGGIGGVAGARPGSHRHGSAPYSSRSVRDLAPQRLPRSSRRRSEDRRDRRCTGRHIGRWSRSAISFGLSARLRAG
jgi:cellulose synthase (UDP-forming)